MSLGEMFYNLALNFGYKHKVDLLPKQRTNKIVTSKEIDVVIKETLGQIHFHWSDKDYKMVEIGHLRNFLRDNTVNKIQYVTNDMDCDDFSYILQGDVTKWDSHLAFGIVWGTNKSGIAHAWNWCIGTDKKIYFIEPQSDKVFLPTVEKVWWVLM